MPESDITKRPKPNASDITHTIAKAGLSGLPIIGGPTSELFSLVITPSLEKRRDQWIESIVESLKALEEKVEGFNIENLRENEMFISTVMQASQAAIRSHQKEKLEALRNAVLNAALPNHPEEHLQLMFLSFVDSFTPSHLKILKSLNDYRLLGEPRTEAEGQKREKSRYETIFPDVQNSKDVYDQIAKDLYSRGLINVRLALPDEVSYEVLVEGLGLITSLGKRFLEFITSPIASEDRDRVAKEKNQER